jgi:glycolate oxidase iron-sulfur subunit
VNLHLDDDDLNACVQCGLCLPHCPTYRVTGDEAMSPRGRIHLMREVQGNDAPITAEVLRSFETCVQCRGCETACPSGVPYGPLMERTREALADAHVMTPRWQRLALEGLAHPGLLRLGTAGLAIGNRARLVPGRLGIPTDLTVRSEPLAASGDDVWLFTGCVMDAWQRGVHRAAQRVLEAVGIGVAPTGALAPCCGALHVHSGLARRAGELAGDVIAALARDDRPILVDSAGCGAALKDYGRLVGGAEAEAFSARVFDVQEWLSTRLDTLPAVAPLALRVAIQDPCHLRHVQRVHLATRMVLAPFVAEIVELDDEGLCCGAGGAYSVLEPELASAIRARKLAAIERARVDVVVSANPGCSLHLNSAGVQTAHPMELVARALDA